MRVGWLGLGDGTQVVKVYDGSALTLGHARYKQRKGEGGSGVVWAAAPTGSTPPRRGPLHPAPRPTN